MSQMSASNNPKTSDFRKKCRSLWKDKRTYKERLLLAAAPSFALCFTFIFFGPVELTAFNQASLAFDVYDITWVMAAAMLAAFAAMTLILAFVKGKLFNYLVTAVFALLVCGYLQGNVLNGPMGALTGEPVNWPNSRGSMFLNFVVWVLLFLLPYCLLYFSRKNWRNVVLYGSALLIVMQAAALVGIYINAEHKENRFLSTKGMEEYASSNNTIVFLVDMMDFEYIEGALKEDPAFFDRLEGFIGFSNATSEFARTRPAADYMLTGYTKDAYQAPFEEYMTESWETGGRKLLQDLKNADYRIDIYAQLRNLFQNGNVAEEYVSNCAGGGLVLNTASLTRTMIYLSAYRYAPVIAKPFFWFYTNDINAAAYKNENALGSYSEYNDSEAVFASEIENFKLLDEQNLFKFYHFNGSHYPYVLKSDGTRSDTETSAVEQTMGCFEIIYQALDQMKKLGIYKNASIIITADHGYYQCTQVKPLDRPDRIGLFYKPAGRDDEPFAFSKAPVSLANIPATLVKASGQDYSDYGKALDDVAEDEENVRYCYNVILENEITCKELGFCVFEVIGDASDFQNWKNTGEQKVRYPFY